MVVDRLRLPPERSALTGMEDFANILQRDYGLKPQGKAAPMSGAARGLNPGDKASGSGSRRDIAAAAAAASGGSFLGRGARNGGISARGSGLDAHNAEESADRDTFVGSGSASGSGSGGGGGYGRSHNSDDPFGASSASGYDDVFGGPPKYASPKFPKPPTMPKTSNLPSFDKPLYDNDIFGGVPGIRTSAPVFDDVFSSQSAPAPSSDDLLAGYPPAEDRKPSSTRHPSRGHVSYAPAGRDSVFDDLLSAGESSRPPGIRNVDTRQSQHVGREQPISRNDPFDEPTGFVDPIISIMQQTAAVGLDSDGSVSSSGDGFPHIASERPSQSSLKGGRQKVTSDPILDSSFREGAGVSSAGSDVHQPSVSPTARADAVLAEEFWVTIDDVALVTHPSTLPPPTRKAPVARQDRFQASAQDGLRHKNHVSEQSAGISRQAFVQEVDGRQSFHQSATTSRVPPAAAEAVAAAAASGIEGLEEFVSGVLYKAGGSNASEDAGTVPDGSGSQVAMQEAMERAEVKLRFAKEAREREREGKQREAMIARAQAREKEEREAREEKLRIAREKQEREREAREERERDRQKIEQLKEREREEKERERRRIEQQKEREREERERERQRIEEQREREREREKDRAAERAAVERAAAEARERTAAEARERAERAAVERATLEARERATRAAAERAAAEARERAAAEARERAAAEARERAADRAAAERAKDQQRRSDNDLDRLFSTRANSEPRQRPANSDSPADMRQSQAFGNDAQLRRASSSMPGVKKVPSSANMGDDWTSLFTQPSQEEFQEIEGETPERRQARWERHHRTLERASKALAEKNQRDLEMQREQAEKHRAGEVLDTEIKRWAAGKEGNLRALLSTLQYVLWPECGWQPVSLADLITGVAVKKAYRKATLCVHPDKVQQKGANVQQKYIAEKVFDLLKEGWNKFNSEELF